MKVQDQLRALLERHCATVRQNVDSIGRMLREVSAPGIRPAAAVGRAEALAHQLKGSSGSVGFPEVSSAAKALDDQLKLLCAIGDDTAILSQMAGVHSLYDELKRQASAITPQSSTLYDIDLSAIARR